MRHSSGERGFTLLELMVVVAIIAIIAAILVPNFFHARAQAAVSACESNIRAISTAAELYYSDNQKYPAGGVVDTKFGGAAPGQYLSQSPKDAANDANGKPGDYTFTPAQNANGTAAYTIQCGGIHDSTAIAQIKAAPPGATHVFYDSALGFSGN